MEIGTMSAGRRRLGGTGPEVSAIGFGSWAIGGVHWRGSSPIGWGEVDDEESIRAVHAALDGGVTFFDTADVYGCGHSERVLSRALAGRSDEVVIGTKFGYTYDEDTKQSPGTSAEASYVRTACEASLRRLEVEAIDLYQFHLGDYPLERAAEVRDVLDELVTEGKIRHFGWSTDDPRRAALFAESPNCAAIQQNYSLFGGNADTLDLCERRRLASIVRGPLAMGLLTGKMTKDTSFAESDVRHGWDFGAEQGRRLAVLGVIRDLLTADGRTLAQGALGWLLAASESFIPIPGIRTVAQARENAGTLEVGPLPDAQFAAVNDAIRDALGSD